MFKTVQKMGGCKVTKKLSQVTELSDEQEQAISLLAEGKTQREAAADVGVDLATLEEWQRIPDFVAALNRRRKEQWNSCEDRLRALLPKALGTIEAALESDDMGLKAAMAVLKIVGLGTHGPSDYGLRPMGDTDAGAIEASWREEEILRMMRCAR